MSYAVWLSSGALAQGFDLAALDELLKGGRATRLPPIVAALEGHHSLTGAGGRVVAAELMPRASSRCSRRLRRVEVWTVRV